MATKDYKCIIYEKKGPIAYITLNRPEKMNALSQTLQEEIREVMLDAGWEDDEIRVIIIKGAGRAFSSGFDMGDELPNYRDAAQREHEMTRKWWLLTSGWEVFWKNPKAIIAQVHGFCLAGGMFIASLCDLCICSEDALFGYPLTRDGVAWVPATWPWILGMRKCKELQFTGNLMDAQEAYRLDFANKVVPTDKLEEEVNKMAKTIAKVPPASIEFSKRAINSAYEEMGIRQVIERAHELESLCLYSLHFIPERRETLRLREISMKAYLDWRKSRFAEEDEWWRDRAARPAEKK